MIIGFISLIPAIFLVGYAFLGFLDWIFNDPFDWLADSSVPKMTDFEKLSEYQECVKNGGVPIRSGWTQRVKRCEK